MFRQWLATQSPLFESTLDALLGPIFQATLAKMQGSAAEPDFVADLAVQLPAQLPSRLQRHLPSSIGLDMTSVFCHQSPKVTYAGMQQINQRSSCEIGDILLVHFDQHVSGQVDRQALLLQAKMIGAFPHALPKADLHQFHLYDQWPVFSYVSPGTLSAQANPSRSVARSGIHPGSRYLAIDPTGGPQQALPFHSVEPVQPLNHPDALARQLTQTFLGNAGEPFVDRAQALQQTDWSRVVWDLLDLSAQTVFNRLQSGHINQPRQHGATPYFRAPARPFDSPTDGPWHFIFDWLDRQPDLTRGPPWHGTGPQGPSRDEDGMTVIILRTWPARGARP